MFSWTATRRICLSAGICFGLVACEGAQIINQPGTTKGVITINSGQVVTRERLLNDRNREVSFLETKLEETASITGFGYQGAADFRSFDAQFFNLRAATDVKKGTIERPGTAEEQGVTKLKDSQDKPVASKIFDANAPLLPKGTPATNVAEASHNDVFRDLLAYREEIRSQILETQLDDRHDLRGNTLYRLQFSPTVLPGANTGSWAVLKLRLASHEIDKFLYERWVRYMERVTNDEVFNLTIAANNKSLTISEMREVLDAADKFLTGCNIKLHRPSGQKAQTKPYSTRKAWARLPDNEAAQRQLVMLIDVAAHRYLECIGEVPGDNSQPSRTQIDSARNGLIAEYVHTRLNREFSELLQTYGGTDCISGVCPLKFAAPPDLMQPEFKELDKDGSIAQAVIRAKDKFNGELQFKIGKWRERVFVYAVTPKEMVQRISDVAARRQASQMGLSLNALVGAVGLDSAYDKIRDSQLLLHAVRRQPLIVGFADRRNVVKKIDDKNKSINPIKPFEPESRVEFGWIIGPAFKLEEDTKGLFGSTKVRYSFRQVNRQNALSAVISLPAWFTRVKFEVIGCWRAAEVDGLDDCGDLSSVIDRFASQDVKAFNDLEDGDSFTPLVTEIPVDLPGDIAAVTSFLVPGARHGDPERGRTPKVFQSEVIANLTVNRKGRIVIPGVNLWRNATVTVGNQKSDRIIVMPDMQGIIAEFNQVLPPPGWPDAQGSDQQPVVVWTSTGRMRAGLATLYTSDAPVSRVTVRTTPYILGRELVLDVASSVLPTNFVNRRVAMRRHDPGGRTDWGFADVSDINTALGEIKSRYETSNPPCDNCVNGSIVEAAFAVQPRPNAEEQFFKAQNLFVIYNSGPEAEIRVLDSDDAVQNNLPDVKVADLKKDGTAAKFILPMNAEKAFRGFRPQSARFEALIGDRVLNNGEIKISQPSGCKRRLYGDKQAGHFVCSVNLKGGDGLDRLIPKDKSETFKFRVIQAGTIKPDVTATLTVTNK